jgi:hypothetical protein
MKHRLSLLILLLTGLQLARAATTLRGSSNSSEDNHLLVSSRGRSLGSMMMRTRSKQTRVSVIICEADESHVSPVPL